MEEQGALESVLSPIGTLYLKDINMIDYPTVTDTSGAINVILGAGGIGAVIWAVAERMLRLRQDRADRDSGISEARANQTLFNMLKERLETLEKEVRSLRAELDRERDYTRALVSTMSAHGVPVPPQPLGVIHDP